MQLQIEQSTLDMVKVPLEYVNEQPQMLEDIVFNVQQPLAGTNPPLFIVEPKPKDIKKLKDEIWFLKFDGSRSKQGSRRGV